MQRLLTSAVLFVAVIASNDPSSDDDFNTDDGDNSSNKSSDSVTMGFAKCSKPHNITRLGLGEFGGAGGRLRNVSSKEACCSSCGNNSWCRYVTYGKYAQLQEEMWACYQHDDIPPNVAATFQSRNSGIFLANALPTLYDDENSEDSCASLGLSDCAGATLRDHDDDDDELGRGGHHGGGGGCTNFSDNCDGGDWILWLAGGFLGCLAIGCVWWCIEQCLGVCGIKCPSTEK